MVSTGKDAGHAGKHLEKIVQCSSGRRVGAELLAQADQDERLQGGVPAALHCVALLGQKNPV